MFSHTECVRTTPISAQRQLSEKRTPHQRVQHNTKLEDQLMARLTGKVAVITGGSSGIGRATAQRFFDEGAHVFIMGRRRSELDKAKALIGDGLSTVAGDVTNSADLDKLFLTVLDTEGGLDILVLNSGRAEAEMLGNITEENFDATFNVNARATLFTAPATAGSTTGPHGARFRRWGIC
jgi:NAD(P)-dependent dehydrogenase (short-subunit alcohol dehydrogenase family)